MSEALKNARFWDVEISKMDKSLRRSQLELGYLHV